jgi:hypothetical protein
MLYVIPGFENVRMITRRRFFPLPRPPSSGSRLSARAIFAAVLFVRKANKIIDFIDRISPRPIHFVSRFSLAARNFAGEKMADTRRRRHEFKHIA